MVQKTVLLLFLFFLSGNCTNDSTTLTMVTCEWVPYLSEFLSAGGLSTDICATAFKRAGYTTSTEFMDWNRAMGLTESGERDVLLGCYNTKERATTYDISDTIGLVEVVFFALKSDSLTYNSLEDFRGMRVGAMRGNAYTPEFDAADYIKKEYVDKMEINIKKLLHKRVTLIIGSKLVIQDYLNNHFPREKDKIVQVYPPLKQVSLHLGVSRKRKDHALLVAQFNKALKKMKADGTYDSLFVKHGFK